MTEDDEYRHRWIATHRHVSHATATIYRAEGRNTGGTVLNRIVHSFFTFQMRDRH